MIRKKEKIVNTKLTFQSRSYRNFDQESFQDKLTNADGVPFYTAEDVDQAWSFLQDVIQM